LKDIEEKSECTNLSIFNMNHYPAYPKLNRILINIKDFFNVKKAYRANYRNYGNIPGCIDIILI